ncbi:MAG TPA: lipocalin family protein [Bacteroidales bacterium]|nr:lipocalin family protein [Bacteroidales bacterium]HPT03106.1 lipocalin family protein [Bacteroidales bacterium]
MNQKKSFSALALAGLALLTQSCASIPKGATVVKPFDKERYLGKWYEIGRLDHRFERNLDNVTAVYSMNNDGTIKVTNSGYKTTTKEWKQVTGKAKPSGKPGEGKLKVSFFGPFYGAYNIIALDEQYRYALVAGNNLKYLWILSRETSIPEDIKLQFLATAKSVGYDTSSLIWVKHDNGK